MLILPIKSHDYFPQPISHSYHYLQIPYNRPNLTYSMLKPLPFNPIQQTNPDLLCTSTFLTHVQPTLLWPIHKPLPFQYPPLGIYLTTNYTQKYSIYLPQANFFIFFHRRTSQSQSQVQQPRMRPHNP